MIKKTRAVNKKARIIATAGSTDDALVLYKAGADYVTLPHFLGGEHVAGLINQVRRRETSLEEERARPGGQFQFENFFNEIAVGTGYGLRLDFSFLLLRLDAAWKIHDPGEQTRYGNVVSKGSLDLPDYNNYKRLVWNLGIGYPF